MKWIRKKVTDGYVKKGLPRQSFFMAVHGQYFLRFKALPHSLPAAAGHNPGRSGESFEALNLFLPYAII